MKRILFFIIFFQIQLSSYSQGHTCKNDYFPVQNPKNRMWGYMNLLGEWSVIAQYTKTYPFRGRVAVVQKGLKYGAINCDFKSVIPVDYDEINPFVGSSGWVRKGDFWGLIHDSGKLLLDPIYTDIEELNHYSSEVWVKTKEELWGLYSKHSGKWIVHPKFRDVKVLNQYFSVVEYRSKKGFIDNITGELKVETNLDKVVKIAPYVSAIKKGDSWGVISDKAIHITGIEFDAISAFSSTKLIVSKDSTQYLINSPTGRRSSLNYDQIFPLFGGASRVKLKCKYGYVNARGVQIVKLDYLDAFDFQSLRAVVRDSLGYSIITPKGTSVFGDSSHFKNIIPINKSKAFVLKTDSNFVIVNDRGIPKLVNVDCHKGDSETIKVSRHSKWCFYDVNEFCLDAKSFDVILGNVNEDYNIVSNGNSFLLYKAFVPKSLSAEFNKIDLTSIENVFIVYLDAKAAVWNNGRIVSELYDGIGVGNYKTFIYKQKNKFGLLSLKGRILTEAKYLKIESIPKQLFCGWGKKSVSVLKSDGKVFFEGSEIKEVKGFREGYFVVLKGDTFYLMNKSGKLNFNKGFEELSLLYGGKCAFRKNGKWGLINKKGSVLIAPQYSSYAIKNGVLILN